MLHWCERHEFSYIVGIAQNTRLNAMAAGWIDQVPSGFEHSVQNQRLFAELANAMRSWKQSRRVIVNAKHTTPGANPRYTLINLPGEPQPLYEQIYCARGEMENLIKEQQLFLFADRTSCMNWLPNQLRLLLSSMAYCLLEVIRSLALKNKQLARACSDTIRLRLLKIGVMIIRNARRVKFFLSSSCPLQSLFLRASKRLAFAG